MALHRLALFWACLGGYGWHASTRRLPNIHVAESHKSSQVADTLSIPLTVFSNLILALDPVAALKLAGPGARLPARFGRKTTESLMSADTATPPVARRAPHKVLFGKVAGENRGPNPMDPAIELEDDYFWLRDDKRRDKEVLGLLRAENAYTEARTETLAVFQEKLTMEINSHTDFLKGDFKSALNAILGAGAAFVLGIAGAFVALENGIDPNIIGGVFLVVIIAAAAAIVPNLATKAAAFDAAIDKTMEAFPVPAKDGYEYWSREYQYLRRPRGSTDDGTVLFDVDKVSEADFFLQTPGWTKEECSIVDVTVNTAGDVLAYSVSGSGLAQYNIRFKDLTNDVELDEQINATDGSITWVNDDIIFYLKEQGDTLRAYQVWKHVVGTNPELDELVFEEKDELFDVSCARSRDDSLVFIQCLAKETNEDYFIPVSNPNASPTLIRAREFGVRYAVDSHAPSQSLYIVSNLGGKENGELFVASLDSPSAWRSVVAAGTQVMPDTPSRDLGPPSCFESFVALEGREDGFTQIWVIPLTADGGEPASGERRLAIGEEAESSQVSFAPSEFRSDGKLRLRFTSPTTPTKLLEYDITTDKYKTLSEEKVNNFDRTKYKSKRIMVTARDGVAVPVSLLWRPDVVGKALEKGGGGAPCHLYGYGSYGEAVEPVFNPSLLSLIDRGIVYAIAHVRGGGEMGNYVWHDLSGKYLTKKNTFNDFVDVGKALLEQGIAKAGALSCEGTSAGGLLVGNVINDAPELFVAAIAQAPFVDLMVHMCDPSQPLTVTEWEEWGNPNEAKYHDYMKSYCPITNVRDGEKYPKLLITSGLNDPNVPYWHGAKWAQVLRSRIANGEDVLLKTNFGGHDPSTDTVQGGDKAVRSLAFRYAWLLDKHGLAEQDGLGDISLKLTAKRSQALDKVDF